MTSTSVSTTADLESASPSPSDATAMGALLADHLGRDPSVLPIVTERFELWDHVNVQVALDAYAAQPGRTVRLVGGSVATPLGGSMFPPEAPSLSHLLAMPAVRPGPVDYVDLPAGPDEELPCIRTGLVLVDGAEDPTAVWVRPDGVMARKVALDVMGSSVEAVQAFFDELRRLMVEHNRFRGQVVRFTTDMNANVRLQFETRPRVRREEVILSEGVLEVIEAHAVGIAEAAPELRAAKRHLKRGLLLYGPPGTGKTLTIGYLASSLPEATVFLLTGSAMGWLTFVTELAARLTPAVIVLDDVDLIAEDRDLGGMSPRRHLFDLLDAMDGVHEDHDLLFVCTTNRPEALEKAISARPGRVDLAVEIGLPDASARRRLLAFYADGLDLALADPDAVLARTEGVTASFVKELLRRAALVAMRDSDEPRITVTDHHVHVALDSLLDPAGFLAPAPRTDSNGETR